MLWILSVIGIVLFSVSIVILAMNWIYGDLDTKTKQQVICVAVLGCIIIIIGSIALRNVTNYKTIQTNIYELVEVDANKNNQENLDYVYISTIRSEISSNCEDLNYVVNYDDVILQDEYKSCIIEYTTCYDNNNISEKLYKILTFCEIGKPVNVMYKVFVPKGIYEKMYVINTSN